MADHNARRGVDQESELERAEPAAAPSRRYAHTLRRGASAPASPSTTTSAAPVAEARDDIATIAKPRLARTAAAPAPHDGDGDLAIPIAMTSRGAAGDPDSWRMTRPALPSAGSEPITRVAPAMAPLFAASSDALAAIETHDAGAPTGQPSVMLEPTRKVSRPYPPRRAMPLAVLPLALIAGLLLIALRLLLAL